jgi:hypothetical protein
VVAGAVREAGVDGPVAAVTAGWKEREEEVDELREHLGQQVINLRLYRRAEEVFAEDPELFRAHRRRQDRLRRLQELYRLRLGHALEAARRLVAAPVLEPDLLAGEQEAAMATVRDLDAHHLGRIADIHRQFEGEWAPEERPAVTQHRAELAELLSECAAVAVAGGHVAVLLNRLRLFDLLSLAGDRPFFAWSAGAMALGEKVVLFHDSPPQGAGNAEVLEAGLGCYRGVLPFPHARRRLRLDDPVRVSVLARRFPDLVCVAMDEGAWLASEENGRWSAREVRRLETDGAVRGWR